MPTQLKWVQLERDLRREKISIHDLIYYIKKYNNFRRVCDSDIEDLKKLGRSIISLKTQTNIILSLIKTKLSPELNSLVYQDNVKNNSYDWLAVNLAKIELRFQKLEQSIFDNLKSIRYDTIENPNLAVIKDSFISYCYEIMTNLAYFPLIKALHDYQNSRIEIDNNEVEKDEKLFWYLVFVQYFHASEVLGTINIDNKNSLPKNLPMIKVPIKNKSTEPTVGTGDFQYVDNEEKLDVSDIEQLPELIEGEAWNV